MEWGWLKKVEQYEKVNNEKSPPGIPDTEAVSERIWERSK